MSFPPFALPDPLGARRRPPHITVHLDRDARTAWIELAGDTTSTVATASLRAQLGEARRRITGHADIVAIDLAGLDRITIDLAVLLCLESRTMAHHDLRVSAVHRGRAPASIGTEQVLAQIPVGEGDYPRDPDPAANADGGRSQTARHAPYAAYVADTVDDTWRPSSRPRGRRRCSPSRSRIRVLAPSDESITFWRSLCMLLPQFRWEHSSRVRDR